MHYGKLKISIPEFILKIESGNIEKLAIMVIVDDKPEITDLLFTDNIINQVASDYKKYKNIIHYMN